MHCMNGTCLLSVFVFILCLHSALSNRQQSRNYVSDQNYTSKTERGFIINSQSLRRPAYNNGRDRNDSIAETTSAGISVTSRSDNGRTIQKWMEWRLKSSKYRRQNLIYPTSGPFLRLSTQADIGVSQGFPSNDEFDIIRETTYLCLSSRDCDNILERSFCDPSGRCRCFYPYLFDGEKCQYRDDIEYCSSHRDCNSVQDRRCILVNSTGDKICKCNYGLIFDERRCLPKVEKLGACVSDKQCLSNVLCTEGVCRLPCSPGYVWRYLRCTKEYPVFPRNNNRDSIITQPVVLFALIGGVPLFMVLIAIAVIIRRHFMRLPSQRNSANSSVDTLRTGSSTARQSYDDSADDQPPSYDEIMSASTLTLPTNAERMNEDPPPSYKSWEEALRCNYPAIPRH